MRLAEKINTQITKFDDRFISLIGREVTYITIARIIREIVKPFKCRVAIISESDELRSEICMSGEYVHDNQQVTLFVHKPKDKDTFKCTRKALNKLRLRIAQIFQHEFLHVEQAEHRRANYISQEINDHIPFIPTKRLSKKRIADIAYLTELDEIDAYAHDIAYEVKSLYPNIAPREVLRTATRRRFMFSLKFYTKAFEGMDWTPVRKRLLARAYKWLPHIIIVDDLP